MDFPDLLVLRIALWIYVLSLNISTGLQEKSGLWKTNAISDLQKWMHSFFPFLKEWCLYLKQVPLRDFKAVPSYRSDRVTGVVSCPLKTPLISEMASCLMALCHLWLYHCWAHDFQEDLCVALRAISNILCLHYHSCFRFDIT